MSGRTDGRFDGRQTARRFVAHECRPTETARFLLSFSQSVSQSLSLSLSLSQRQTRTTQTMEKEGRVSPLLHPFPCCSESIQEEEEEEEAEDISIRVMKKP